MEDNIYVIYAITCKVNGKVYIGQTKNVKQRFQIYRSSLRHNNCHNSGLQEDFNKYGMENFIFEVIHRTNNYDELDLLETAYIVAYDSVENGYNGGYGNYKKNARILGLFGWNISLQKIKDEFEYMYPEKDVPAFIDITTGYGKFNPTYYYVTKDGKVCTIRKENVCNYWTKEQIYADKIMIPIVLNEYLNITYKYFFKKERW